MKGEYSYLQTRFLLSPESPHGKVKACMLVQHTHFQDLFIRGQRCLASKSKLLKPPNSKPYSESRPHLSSHPHTHEAKGQLRQMGQANIPRDKLLNPGLLLSSSYWGLIGKGHVLYREGIIFPHSPLFPQ